MSTLDRKPQLPDAHPSVYLLADHLDALLAAGEDIGALGLRFVDPAGHRRVGSADLRLLTESARALELTIVARVLQARDRCRELRGVDLRFRQIIDLFLGGTAVLADAIDEYGDTTLADFQSGDDLVVYLGQRGVLDTSVSDAATARALRIGPGFRIVGRIELGPLMDMCASFLDLIEAQYALFHDGDATKADAAAA